MGLFDLFKKEKKNTHTSVANVIDTFTFKSNQHQRFENDLPIKEIQKCIRIISVEKNINGCSGYKLKPGEGIIFRIINGDTNQPQMSAKPMNVVKQSNNMVEFRGYKTIAQTPFGWQEFDLSDYGLTIIYESGNIEKCILHMYDRNTRIEYMK